LLLAAVFFAGWPASILVILINFDWSWYDLSVRRQVVYSAPLSFPGELLRTTIVAPDRYVVIPWLIYFLMIAGIYWLPRLIANRESRPGRCIQCGYDLTGNVSGTGPECGTPIKV